VSAGYFNRNLGAARRWTLCLIAGISLLSACKKVPTTESAAAPVGAPHPAPSPPDSRQAPAPTPVESSANAVTPARPSGPLEFTDITAQAGIHFKHNTGAFGKKYLPETMGSGVCFIDYDNDGW
jgi:enediyne biosynthesis protein E4